MAALENSLKVLFLLFIASLSAIAVADEGFLSASELLRAAKIQIYPAQSKPGGIILPVFYSNSNVPITLLANDGHTYELKRVVPSKEMNLDIDTCGPDKETVVAWTSTAKKTGQFIFTGKLPPKWKLSWTPVLPKKVSVPSCLHYKANYKMSHLKAGTVKGVSGAVFLADFESPNAVKRKANPAKDQYQERNDIEADCSVSDYKLQMIGFISPNGACEILRKEEVNCEGQGFENGSFDKPLGLIEISNGPKSEKWLIFLAHGYEGDAYLGVRLSKDRPIKDSDLDFYVYSGC